MHKGRMLLAVGVLIVIAAGVASAYDYTIKGEKPSWWDDTSGCVSWTKAEWTTWDQGFVDGFGPVPDSFETNLANPVGPDPTGRPDYESWKWISHPLDHEHFPTGVGALVEGGKNNYGFELELGNENLAPIKNWYLEFELDRVPSGDGTWDESRFTPDTYAKYQGPGATRPFDVIDSGWKTLTDDAGADYLVWWGLFSKKPQPDWEGFIWNWDTNSGRDSGVDDFYIRRVTTGTCCTPEPVSMALLALGLPAGMLLRRRRR